jgi:hypothetical protein
MVTPQLRALVVFPSPTRHSPRTPLGYAVDIKLKAKKQRGDMVKDKKRHHPTGSTRLLAALASSMHGLVRRGSGETPRCQPLEADFDSWSKSWGLLSHRQHSNTGDLKS